MRNVVDARGTAVSLPDRVGRVVSLVPSLTEWLVVAGVGERLVGVTDWCVEPAGALDLGLAPGDEVVHRQWGRGVVATVTGQGERVMAEVDFPGLGRKRLLLRYAPLTRP